MNTPLPDARPSRWPLRRRSVVTRTVKKTIADSALCELLESRQLLSAGPPVIAMLDTGVNNVQEVVGHIYANPHESSFPVGVDLDFNGFANDVQGWNFASSVTVTNGVVTSTGITGDNLTVETNGNGIPHGTYMAEAALQAAASVGNQGIQILPVKIALTHSALTITATGGATIVNNGTSGNELGLPTVPDLLTQGINYAVKLKIAGNANVVAITLDMGGITSRDPKNDPALFGLRAAIKLATGNGIVILTGAGNWGNNNDLINNFPANFASEFNLVVPVAGTDGGGNLFFVSNYGPNTVRFAAPELVTVPNVTNGALTQANGNEFAAAEVAGVIAGLIADHPDISPAQALNYILQGLTPNPTLTHTTTTGGAMLNFARIAQIAASSPPVGAIESLTNSSVSGYVYDVDTILQPLFSAPPVTLVIDGNTVVSDVPATTHRPDVLAFTIPSNNPNGSVPPGTQIAGGYTLDFGPLLAGTHTISIYARDIPSNNLVLVATRNITISVPTLVLTGPQGQQIVQGQTVEFGNVPQGSQSDNTFTVTNTGNQVLNVFTPVLPAGYTLIKDTSHILAPGQSDTFTIRLDSTAPTPTQFIGNVTVNSNDPSGLALTFTISGAVGASFLTNLYATLLHRAPDLAGLAFWNQQLASHAMTTTQVAAEFINSTEYHTTLIQNLYTTLLHRAADPAGLAGWVSYLDAGGNLEDAQIAFLSSNEYYVVHGLTAQSVVTAYYQDILGRAVDASGLAAWSGQLLSGAPRFQVVTTLFYSGEGLAHTVNTEYLTYLGRTADSAGQSYWSAQLGNHAVTELQMAASLLGSQEFFLLP